MSTALAVKRHALGLPAGSVRATHILGIVGLVCGLLLVPPERNVHVPPYLIYLLFLGLGHYFAAHGADIAPRHTTGPSPLYLPPGTVRVLIVLLLGGTIGWRIYANPEALLRNFEASLEEMKGQPYVLLAILGAFFLGVIVRRIMGRDNPPQAWQDFEAWISILALVGLMAAAIVHLIIGVSLPEQLSLPLSEGILGAGIAFYFGARS
jgi:hypothetical protein